MNKTIKTFAIICAAVLAAGLIIGGIGYMMGGVRGIDKLAEEHSWIQKGAGERVIMSQTVDAYDSVEVIGNADVYMVTKEYYKSQPWLDENELLSSTEADSAGDHQVVVIKGDKVPDPVITVEGGLLKINAKDEKNSGITLDFSSTERTPKILICCPEEELKSVKVSVDTGDIELGSIKYQDASLETDTGDISTLKVEGDSQQISSDTGDIDLNGVFAKPAKIKTDTGDIDLEGSYLGDVDIKSDTGDVSLDTAFGMEIYGDIDLKSDTGDITVSVGDKEIANIDSSPAHYTLSGEGIKLTVITDTGDIELSFGEHAD